MYLEDWIELDWGGLWTDERFFGDVGRNHNLCLRRWGLGRRVRGWVGKRKRGRGWGMRGGLRLGE